MKRVAFYAPMKPPDHEVPSGDRRMARLLMAALARAGMEVELASRLRAYDRAGDPGHQHRIACVAAEQAANLERTYRQRALPERPQAWFTYHVYHKSPDWLGPVLAPALDIPYLIAEASFAAKQTGGPWAFNQSQVERAIRLADLIFAMTAIDAAGLEPLITPPARLCRLLPFLDPAPFEAAVAERSWSRAQLAAAHGLDPSVPWLIVVAMMREDIKRESYHVLADALERTAGMDWELMIIGDGPARAEIQSRFASLGRRARFLGRLEEQHLPRHYAASDLFVWPALREAYGLALLEAQAAGTPVVAGDEGGVRDVVRDDVTGLLVRGRDAEAIAGAVAELLRAPDRRLRMGETARAFVVRERSLDTAAEGLRHAFEVAIAIRSQRAARWRAPG